MIVYLLHVLCLLGLAAAGWVAYAKPHMRWGAVGASVALACAAASLLWIHSEPQHKLFSDFYKAYRPAGEAVLYDHSHILALYEPAHFVNIPLVSLLFVPFAAMPYEASGYVFLVLGLIALGFVAYHLFRNTDGDPALRVIVVLAVLAANGPLFNSLREGNSTHFLFLLILPGAYLLGRGRPVPAGVLLALAALLKLPLAMFGFYFLVTRQWKALAAFAATGAFLGLLSVAIFGLPMNKAWHEKAIQPFQKRPIAAFNTQSVSGVVARAMSPGHLWDWNPIKRPPKFRTIRNTLTFPLVAITFLTIVFARSPRTPARVATEMAAVMTLAFLISPLTWTHYYLMLAWPAAMLLTGTWALPKSRLVNALLLLGVLLFMMPVILAIPEQPFFAMLYERVLLSHFFFGAVLILSLLVASLWFGNRLDERMEEQCDST
jgi:alpha-1,2-mannosyltransferase